MTKSIWLIYFSILPFISTAQTCVIVLRLSDGIVIAADSRRTHFLTITDKKGNKTDSVAFSTICKMGRSGNIFYSNAGLDIENGYKLANEAALNSKTIKEAAEYFLQRRKSRVKNYLDSIANDKRTFYLYFERMKNFGAIFYGIEGNIPKMISVDVSLVSKVDEPILLQGKINYNQPDSTNLSMAFTIGEHNIADSLIGTSILNELGAVEGLKYIITKQSDSTPQTVAPPFEIFTLYLDGSVKWDYDPLGCNLLMK